MSQQLPAHVETLIVGAGLAGLSTALHLGPSHDLLILEAYDYVGGKARTERIGEFLFDVTGHWLHLRDEGIRQLVFGLLGESHFHKVDRISRIWSHGVYTEYPFQANTHGLPPAVVHECLMGAIRAARERPEVVPPEGEPESFAEWIRFYFGEGIARHFMVPYNARLWGVSAEEITSRWCQRFVPKPRLEDIVAGAVGLNAGKMGYNAHFLYPREGGIQSVAEALADAVGRDRIALSHKLAGVDLDRRVARLAGGRTLSFGRLVSTAPLPFFVELVDNVPEAVRAATGRLRATPVTYFNVGVRGTLGVPDHWVYVPEAEWPMYRVGSFSNAVPSMAPPGHASLYVELADRDTPPEALVPRVTEGLVKMGFIEHADQVLFMVPRHVPLAYVIYDFAYTGGREAVHAYLSAHGVQSIGRYGDWNYSSMEDALLDGRRAAERIHAAAHEGATL
jgi:protoporphyrinogen oxidase